MVLSLRCGLKIEQSRSPLILVVLLSFLFTKVFRSSVNHYALYILVGLIPYNFFSIQKVLQSHCEVTRSRHDACLRFPCATSS